MNPWHVVAIVWYGWLMYANRPSKHQPRETFFAGAFFALGLVMTLEYAFSRPWAPISSAQDRAVIIVKVRRMVGP